jgi:hypothetical protein
MRLAIGSLAIPLAACGSGSGLVAGTASDGGPAMDATQDSPSTIGTTVAPRAPIACQHQQCDPSREVCCFVIPGGMDPPPPTWSCLPAANCASQQGASQSLGCLGASNCNAGDVCCRSRSLQVLTASCAPACTATEVQVCDSSAECPAGRQCLIDPGGASVCDFTCSDGENIGVAGGACGVLASHWEAYEYVPSRSAVVSSIRLYAGPLLAADGGVGQVGLFDSVVADASAYQPGALLAMGTLAVTEVPRWDNANLDQPVMVTQGHTYFIGENIGACSSQASGSRTIEYESSSPTGPWAGPFSASFRVQVCP